MFYVAHDFTFNVMKATSFLQQLRPLVFSAYEVELETCRRILDAKPTNATDLVMQRNSAGSTCLHFWAQKDELEQRQLVSHAVEIGADVNVMNFHGSTPLHMAAQFGASGIITHLLTTRAEMEAITLLGETPLIRAAQYGCTDAVQVLLQAGADVDRAMDNGNTALIMASQNGKADVVQVLLQNGADANRATNDGATATYMAAQGGHLDALKALIDSGSDVNRARIEPPYDSPLVIAAYKGHCTVCTILLEHNADSTYKAAGKTALDWANGQGHTDVEHVLHVLREASDGVNNAQTDGCPRQPC